MPNDLPRSHALVASLLALIPPRPATPPQATTTILPCPNGPARRTDTRLFPYPESVKLLDAIDGAFVPPRSPSAPSGSNGERAIGFPAGARLMDEVLAAGEEVLALAREMRSLAVAACRAALTPEQRTQLNADYQAHLAGLAALVRATTFYGIPLLDGSRDVRLVLPPSRTRTKFVDLPDWRTSSLDLEQSLATLFEAQVSLDCIDTGIDVLVADQSRLALARRELLEGDPDGGLREVERLLLRMRDLAKQASDGRLNTSDRTLLDADRQSDLARLEEVAELAFDGVHVLEAGRVILQGALGTSLLFDLPVMNPDALGVVGPPDGITRMTAATETFEQLDLALAEVRAERKRVAETRDTLVNGFLRLR